MTQPDHAALAAELARHWGFAGLAGDSDAEFLAAVAAHDAGWGEVDAAPRFHPEGSPAEGSPISFLEWPLVEVVNIWRRSIAEVAALGETARHVVARHFCLLAENVRSRPLQPDERQVLEAFLGEGLGEWEGVARSPGLARLTCLTELLQVCDLVSLHLLTGGQMNTVLLDRLGIASVFQAERNWLGFEPYPFDSTLSLSCPACFLPHGSRVPQPGAEMRFAIDCLQGAPIPR